VQQDIDGEEFLPGNYGGKLLSSYESVEEDARRSEVNGHRADQMRRAFPT